MALIGLLLVAFTIVFFTVFSTQQDRQGESFQVISGFIEVLGINFLLIVLLVFLTIVFSSSSSLVSIPLYGFAGLGVLQLAYVVPRSLFLKRRQRWARLKGVIGAAVIVALINGRYWVFLAGFGSV